MMPEGRAARSGDLITPPMLARKYGQVETSSDLECFSQG
jgi:hypothetical protein